jgi:SAM-dependent methyltransferase
MKINTFSDVYELLGAYIPSAILGMALESGLFWMLDEQPRPAADVAREMNIPHNRCRYVLDLLVDQGLLSHDGEKYSPSKTAYATVMSSLTRESWATLAKQWEESIPSVCKLPIHIHEPGSVWKAMGCEPPNYFLQLKESPECARRFTHMLFEFHQPLADEFAEVLDMNNVKRLMDLGGGSGVMSMAICHRHPHTVSTIVDIQNVCKAGRKIVEEHSMSHRIGFFPADFTKDELPVEFDMILECDVCIYDDDLMEKLLKSLNPNGRLVIVDRFAREKGAMPPGRPITWGFSGSLINPDYNFPTVSDVQERLVRAGFKLLSERVLSDNWHAIETEAK